MHSMGCPSSSYLSPWQRLYQPLDGQAYITLTGFDVTSIHNLCFVFSELFDTHAPFVDEFVVPKEPLFGRPQKVCPV